MSGRLPVKDGRAPTPQTQVRTRVVLLAVAAAALVAGLLGLAWSLLQPQKHEPRAIASAAESPEPPAGSPAPQALPAPAAPVASRESPQVLPAASASAAGAPRAMVSARVEPSSSVPWNPGLSPADLRRELAARERLLEQEVELAKQRGDEHAVEEASARLERYRSRRVALERGPAIDAGP